MFHFCGRKSCSWRSKKQNVVARSSAESEFRGMALGICGALWLRLLLTDLGYPTVFPKHLVVVFLKAFVIVDRTGQIFIQMEMLIVMNGPCWRLVAMGEDAKDELIHHSWSKRALSYASYWKNEEKD